MNIESLKKILYERFIVSEGLMFYGERPNLNESVEAMIRTKNDGILDNKSVYFDDFKLFLRCLDLNAFKVNLDSLIDFYFFFESSTFVFVTNKNDLEPCFDMLTKSNPSWECLSNKYRCEVLFRGIEEDILWRGKS